MKIFGRKPFHKSDRISDQHPVVWSPKPLKRGMGFRWLKYLFLSSIIYGTIWFLTFAYLNKTPTFTSRWSLVLPGTGVSAKTRVDGVGETSTGATSPFGIASANPRVSYKVMLMSKAIREKAASYLEMELSDFGEAKITMVEQTLIMNIRMMASTPELADMKSWALWDVFQDHLNELRENELNKRETAIRKSIEMYREKLEAAAKALLDHRAHSEYVSAGQFDEGAARLERLRGQLMEANAEFEHKLGIATAYSTTLGITPKQAANAFTLHADDVYQFHKSNHAKAKSQLALSEQRWGKNHPRVLSQKNDMNAAFTAMQNRAFNLTGSRDISFLEYTSIGNQNTKSELFTKVISSYSELDGLRRKMDAIQNNLDELRHKMKYWAKDAAILEELERNHKVAEAVFTAAVSRIDAAKADIFASYPMVQILNKPKTGIMPTSPVKSTGIAGAVIGTIFATFGLIILWQRKKLYERIATKMPFG